MSVLDIFFPKYCLNCDIPGKYVCKSCLKKVNTGKTKYLKIGDFESVTFIWEYQGVIRKAILRLKYNFAYDVAEELAKNCIEQIQVLPFKKRNLLLIPIPLHKSREKWRGFNQSDVLGRAISTGLGWEYEQNLLTRTLASKQQVGLGKKERLRNIRGKFAVNTDILPKIDHKTPIVIFDDVWTTGSTMKEAASTIKRAGFKEVYGMTICG